MVKTKQEKRRGEEDTTARQCGASLFVNRCLSCWELWWKSVVQVHIDDHDDHDDDD